MIETVSNKHKKTRRNLDFILIQRTTLVSKEKRTREDMIGQKDPWTGKKGDRNITLR
jgi:hypothetical protein